MPELPEAETIRRDLTVQLKGAVLEEIEIFLPKMVRSSPEKFRSLLLGQKLKDIFRRGKLLGLEFERSVLLVHLGMTGALVLKDQERPPHTHLVFIFDRGVLLYTDLRQFGWLEALSLRDLSRHSFISSLGPDALDIDYPAFERLMRSSRRKLKALLLDQHKIAGLGNIYADEILFRSGIHPERRAASMSSEEIQRLYRIMKEVLSRAIELRGSSVRNYVDGKGKTGRFQEEHLVYGKRGRPCPRCGSPLKYKIVAGRGTTFCSSCQR